MLHQISQRSIKKIGLFDSGLGGLTIVEQLLKLPLSHVIYIADTANLPYGNKTPEQLLTFGNKLCQFLIDHKVDAIVAACHTLSATHVPQLQTTYNLPIISMLETVISQAAQTTQNKKIGIIGTVASITTHAHKAALVALDPSIKVFEQPTPELVTLIEAQAEQQQLEEQLEIYLKPLRAKKIDTLILGCTHYGIIKKTIQASVGPEVKLITSEHAINELMTPLIHLETKPTATDFFATSNPEGLQEKSRQLLGLTIDTITLIKL